MLMMFSVMIDERTHTQQQQHSAGNFLLRRPAFAGRFDRQQAANAAPHFILENFGIKGERTDTVGTRPVVRHEYHFELAFPVIEGAIQRLMFHPFHDVTGNQPRQMFLMVRKVGSVPAK